MLFRSRAWNGKAIDPQAVVYRPDSLNGVKLPWHAATGLQEIAFINALKWLCINFGIKPDDVCDHAECALPRGRKMDIGGVISWTMEEVRMLLADPNSGGLLER